MITYIWCALLSFCVCIVCTQCPWLCFMSNQTSHSHRTLCLFFQIISGWLQSPGFQTKFITGEALTENGMRPTFVMFENHATATLYIRHNISCARDNIAFSRLELCLTLDWPNILNTRDLKSRLWYFMSKAWVIKPKTRDSQSSARDIKLKPRDVCFR